jgi:hypothetical protein
MGKNMNQQKKLAEEERDKATMTLPAMLQYLNEHPERHTPFMDRWFRLCVEHGTQIYPVRREDAQVGRRYRHGTPARIIEVVESCLPFGKPGVWWAKVVA